MRFRAWALRLLIILRMALVVPASHSIILSAETPGTVATTPAPAPAAASGAAAADASQQAKKASDAANKVEQAASTAASLIEQAEKYRKNQTFGLRQIAEDRAVRGFTTRALGQTCRSHAQEIIGFLGGLTESVVVW